MVALNCFQVIQAFIIRNKNKNLILMLMLLGLFFQDFGVKESIFSLKRAKLQAKTPKLILITRNNLVHFKKLVIENVRYWHHQQ